MAVALALLILVVAYIAAAIVHAVSRNRSFHQSALYLPFKLVYRIREGVVRPLDSGPPVIYAILHQSRLDPALMLSLLPGETLHILDERSARSMWLEPWREMARTIAFNARHVFVSRRLVRVLRGNGRLAVYLPASFSPETRQFRIYRAVTRIAETAGAEIVAISIKGGQRTAFSLDPARRATPLTTRLEISALPALSVPELRQRSTRQPPSAAYALYERLLEADGSPTEAVSSAS